MKIHKKDRTRSIDSKVEIKEKICLICEKQHYRSKLTRRPNYNEVDADMWLYCPNCHNAFLQRDTRMEGRLKSAVDIGIYEEERTIMGLDNLTPMSPQQKQLKERLEKEKDPDVIKLLKQGYTVEDQQV